jgi:CelD/BcsL family acetyltransferase involved in cellulose biosynthesis
MLATRDAQPIDEPVGWCEPARRLVAGTAASCEAAALRYEHVTTVEAFRNLESRWRALDASNITITSPFQSFGWLDCWVDAHLVEADDTHETPDLAIVCGYDPDGDLVLVLPLMMCSSRAIRQLTWLGAPLAQYGDVLMDAQHASSDVIEQGLAYAIDTFRPDVICLSKVRSDAAIARYLQERPGSVVESETARFVTLLPEHASSGTTASNSAKARKNRRRQLRRLNEQHDVAFTQQPCGAKMAATARAGLAMKRAWLNDRGLVSAALQCSCADRFFIKAAQRADTGLARDNQSETPATIRMRRFARVS